MLAGDKSALRAPSATDVRSDALGEASRAIPGAMSSQYAGADSSAIRRAASSTLRPDGTHSAHAGDVIRAVIGVPGVLA